jgi:hypothetical protein
MCMADGAGPPVPLVCPGYRELFPGGEGCGGPHQTGHPPAAQRGHQLTGTHTHTHTHTRVETKLSRRTSLV